MNDKADKVYQELARRVFAAVISYEQGITLQYAYNKYAKGEEMSPLWLDLAEAVLNVCHEARNASLARVVAKTRAEISREQGD